MSADLIDRFHRAIHVQLVDDMDSRVVRLASGSAEDFAAYKHQCGYVQALSDVLRLCREIEADMYGPERQAPPAE